MTFTVTYRAKDGALSEETVEAADRAACVAVCRARGIAPVSVREGRASARPSDKSAASSSGRARARPSHGVKLWRAAILVTAVLAVGVGVWWFAVRGDRNPTDLSVGTRKCIPPAQVGKPVTPKVTNPVPESADSVPQTNPPPKGARISVQATSDPYGGLWHGQKIVAYTVKTNGWSTYERIVTADGKKHGLVGTTVKPLFDNGSDQLLAMAVRTSQDTEMPPMPLSPLVESDFLESLKKPIVINDDDSEEVKQLKRDVMQAREDMMDLMNKGMTVEQALAEHFKMSNENVAIRNKAVEELRAILDSGDEEGAVKYMEAVNATLEKIGAMKIEIPEERLRGRKRRNHPDQN